MEKIQIIYEDENMLAINKPAGLIVHPVTRYALRVPSLAEWLLEKYPEIASVGDEPEVRPGIVHRLDKDTSGVLLIAKNQKSFEWLKEQFMNRKIRKKYLVLVEGNLKEKEGVIDLPIGKSRTDFRKKKAGPAAGGKIREALTEYKALKRFEKFTLAEVFPKTGRTHQIRVHFAALGHPVVGDKLYGSKISPLERQFLHAESLELTLIDGMRIKIEADLPEDLKNFLNVLDYGHDKNR